MNKRTAADLVRPLLSESEADDETTKKDKVVKIVSSSWRDIIHDKKNKIVHEKVKEQGFFLDFGDDAAAVEKTDVAKPKKEVKTDFKEKQEKKREKKKKEKEKDKDKQKANEPKERIAFEELPRKL